MTDSQSIRFAITSFRPTREGLLADAEKAESLEYDTFVTADHLFNQPAPVPTVMMVAKQTSSEATQAWAAAARAHYLPWELPAARTRRPAHSRQNVPAMIESPRLAGVEAYRDPGRFDGQTFVNRVRRTLATGCEGKDD